MQVPLPFSCSEFEFLICILLVYYFYSIENKKKIAERKKTSFKLACWNINGVVQNSHSLQERLEKADSWWPKDFNVNVIALQEVFLKSGEMFNNVEFVKIFLEKVTNTMVKKHIYPLERARALETSGLMTSFSENDFEIVSTKFEPFQKKRSYDTFANKGFLDLILKDSNSNSNLIHLINVHLQSIMTQKDWTLLGLTQRSQIEQLLMYARDFKNVIICGDFNIRDDSWMGLYLQARMFSFGFKKVKTKKFSYENEYLDQVWVKGSSNIIVKENLFSEKDSLISSDHVPIFVEIEF